MTLQPLLNAGVQGMQQSQRQMVRSAQEIAGTAASTQVQPDPLQPVAGPQPSQLAESLIDMKAEQHIFDASAKVVSTADKLLGSLLDTTA